MIPLPFEMYNIYDGIIRLCKQSRYAHLGRNPVDGFDCVGLMTYVFDRLSPHLRIDLPVEAHHYSKDFWRRGASQIYLANLEKHFMAVKPESVQKGDIYLFTPGPEFPSRVGHTGLVHDMKGTFVHVMEGMNVCESNIAQKFFQKRLFGAMRHRKMHEIKPRAMAVDLQTKLR